MSGELPELHALEEKSKSSNFCGAFEQNDTREIFKKEHDTYTRYKILYDAVQDTISNSKYLDSELRIKVQDILVGQSCVQVVDLESHSFSLNSNVVLGLTDLCNDELNYDESLKVKKALQVTLQDKHERISKHFYKTTGKNLNTVLSTTNDFKDLGLDERALFSLKNDLKEQQRRYLENLLKKQEILEDIVKLRLNKLPKVCNDKIKECEIKSRMSELQTKIIKEKKRVGIFMETENSLAAYKELIKDIREQQRQCQTDIQYFQNLKETYKQVSCKQYDALLKTYIQYKKALEKKKMIYQLLQP